MKENLFENFFNDIFDVIDDFEHYRKNFNSKKHSMGKGEIELNKSYLKIYKKLAIAIKKLKIEQIPCKEGDLFNPNFHDAKDVTSNKKVKENAVVKVIAAGYQKNGKLLKPVSVIVNKIKKI